MAASPQLQMSPTGTAILAEITANLSAGDDLPGLLGRFLAPVVRLAGADGGAVRLLDDSDNKLHLISELDAPPHLCRGQRVAEKDCGFCGAAASAPRVVWADDLRPCGPDAPTPGELAGAPLSLPGAAPPAAPGGGHRMLAVPLQHRGKVLGVYNLFFRGCGQPGPEVLSLLRSVGELLGLALHNARLESENLRATLLHERQLMAAEVHDSVAQSLAFVKMRLPLLRDAMQDHDEDRALQYFDELRGAVSQAHSSLRGILTHFRSPMDPQGLVHALNASAQTFRRSTGTELDFINEVPGLQLPADQESQVFHIVQEALSNVARHAAAQHARLHIGPAPGLAGHLEVRVEDDGAGLPRPVVGGGGQSSHYGLEIMRERARRIGGQLVVSPRCGGGTVVCLQFPLQQTGAARTQPKAGVGAH